MCAHRTPVGVSPAGCWPQLGGHSRSGLGSSWRPLESSRTSCQNAVGLQVLQDPAQQPTRAPAGAMRGSGMREGPELTQHLPCPPGSGEHRPVRRRPAAAPPRSLSKLEDGPLSKPSTLLGNRVLAFLPPGLITGPSSARGSGVGACTPTGPPGRPPHAWREEPQSSKVLVSEPSDTAGGGQRARLPWGPALPFLARAHPGEVRTQECRSPSRPPRPSTRGGMNKTRSVRAMDDDSAREVG